MSGKVYRLEGEQRSAVEPEECVWLSASAGTGKTQVLSARVLRLLLQPENDPSQILCLTFTKAGAAEMAVRVNEVLARWVRLDDADLGKELDDLGSGNDPVTRARARSLFASVLDTPGGGLRIDTIHAFAQWLLAAFPQEAGIQPGSRAMEDRDRELLAREVLAEMLTTAKRNGDRRTTETIASLSLDKGADAVLGWMMKCASASELWAGKDGWQPPMRPRLCLALDISADAERSDAAKLCADDAFDIAALKRCRTIFADWSAASGTKAVDTIDAWLAADPDQRLDLLPDFFGTIMTKAGASLANVVKRDDSYVGEIDLVRAAIARVTDLLALIDLADGLAPLLEVGREFALRWDEAKNREGFVDFDDQIRKAAELLNQKSISGWIRYKLDRQFDHILIDEAQDTNAAQWAIIHGLIDDYFAGAGARDDKLRTIFTVGDYKQAIFRFQGTSPENFEAARQRVRQEMNAAANNAEQLKADIRPRRLREYGLDQSFRTAAPVLEFVDKAIEAIGWERIGLAAKPEPHIGQDRPGQVVLWNYVTASDSGDRDDDEDTWLEKHDRLLADKIAQQVRRWMVDGFALVKGKKRRATPGDVMILVRKRKELAGLIVARLHAAGVSVAGVDRLRLGNPLAVKDLMAALRFAAQPLDDLSLANLLVSPLIGWSQDQLLEFGYRSKGVHLWDHIKDLDDPQVAQTTAILRDLLARTDFELPQSMLHWLLTGPVDGRRKLVRRLGREVNDPIDELLNAAQAYAANHAVSLQGFVQWFDAGDGELKREAGENFDQVRVMTVHGAKGLQAPIVILADAAGKPGDRPDFALKEKQIGDTEGRKIPLPGLSKDQIVGPLEQARDEALAQELEEHWRLLYVAMTRAEEALFIGGSLGAREVANGPHQDSWFARIKPLFGDDAKTDDLWGARWEWGDFSADVPTSALKPDMPVTDLPAWLRESVGPEPRPPRPLAPSSVGDDLAPQPPLPPDIAREAARRGVLLHSLLERLPEVKESEREALAGKWLANRAADLPEQMREEIAKSALKVLDDPEFAKLFSARSLAEVPLAATVNGQVISGTVDRLLIGNEEIRVVDYKTARRPPAKLEEVPRATLRQMAAYAAALREIYPGRTVRAALLYTQTPRLVEIPPELLDEYKPQLPKAQESFAAPFVE